MSKLRFNVSMSLDGFVAGPDQSEENPLGVGGMDLHQWLFPLAVFRETHGEADGEVNASTPVVEGWTDNVGAILMGRNMFGGGPGPWSEDADAWNGWWGDDPPFHVPVYVITHHPREPLQMKGGTTFHFVTDGIEAALEEAKEAAGGKDVSIAGGAAIIQQYLASGLIDEMDVSVAPIFLRDGARLFESLGDAKLELEQVRVVEAPGVAHLKYRVR
jgi:dihydrofolate reductase